MFTRRKWADSDKFMDQSHPTPHSSLDRHHPLPSPTFIQLCWPPPPCVSGFLHAISSIGNQCRFVGFENDVCLWLSANINWICLSHSCDSELIVETFVFTSHFCFNLFQRHWRNEVRTTPFYSFFSNCIIRQLEEINNQDVSVSNKHNWRKWLMAEEVEQHISTI